MQDASTKKRTARGAQSGAHTRPERRPFGERNGQAKLTEEQVLEIRRRYSAGEKQHRLAVEHGMTDGAISDILAGRNWKYLELDDIRRPHGLMSPDVRERQHRIRTVMAARAREERA